MDDLEGTTGISEDIALLDAEETPEQSEGEDSSLPEPEEQLESDELAPEEVIEEEETPENVEDIVPTRPSLAQIKALAPDLLKKLPGLRDIYFREVEYSKLFPTVADAKIASQSLDNYTAIQNDIATANTEGLFKSIGAESVSKLAPNLLSSLYKVNKDAHWDAIAPVLEGVVQQFFAHGKSENNENLQNAALHLSKFLFNDMRVAKGEVSVSKRQVEESPDAKRVRERESELDNRERDAFRGAVNVDAEKEMNSLILARGQGNKLLIDPEGVYSKYMRDIITEKIAIEVNKRMTADESHMKLMNSLWNKAKSSKYQGDSKAKILTAYLARAKSLVPAVRSKILSEMSGSPESSTKAKDISDKVVARREPGRGSPSSNGRAKSFNPKEIDWDKTSDADLLDDKPTLKKR